MKILTDYLILSEQSPVWKERTDYLFDKCSYLKECSEKIPFPFLRKAFACLHQSHIVNALRILRLRKHYDMVITGIFQVSEIFGFLQYLFPKKRVPHLVIDFMLDEEKKLLLWNLKVFFQKKAFGQAERIVVFSREEEKTYSKRFSIPAEKFISLPYHTNVILPKYIPGKKNTVFSAGRSGRNYKTFFSAIKNLPVQVVLVCDKDNLKDLEIPTNCRVYYSLEHKDYLKMLKEAELVVIPLNPFVRSMGLMVMLEAMAYGKPVIVSRGVSNVEYVKDNENALFCEYNNPEDMREKILDLLENPAKRTMIGRNALKSVREKWTFDIFVQNLFKVIENKE